MTSRRLRAAAYMLWAVGACGSAHECALTRYEFSQAHMGTRFKIILYAPDATTASQASDAAFRRIARLDDTMSDYRPSSELMSLCQRAGGPPMRISDDLYRILARSQALARRSGGAFDVTVGPVVRLWRRAHRRGELPDKESLARAHALVGYPKLRLDSMAHTAHLLKRGMLLDLGGIAKGYAADEALAVLKKHDIASALVAAGGDIAVSAPPPGHAGWRVGIAPLEAPENPPTQFLLLHDAGVSTSGDAEQHAVIGGRRYSHIVDPRTGLALVDRSSVTVVGRDATTSDGLATAISVLGPDRGIQLVKSTHSVGVYIVQANGQARRTLTWNLHLLSASELSER